MENVVAPGDDEVLEGLNLTDPARIQRVHAAYFQAGSDFVITNSFEGNRLFLEPAGYDVRAVNEAAVEIARAAADAAYAADGRQRYVAFDIGPVGSEVGDGAAVSPAEAYELFREQAEAGAPCADFVILETFENIEEIKIAYRAVKDCRDLPVVCSMSFEADGHVASGEGPAEAALALQALGADAVGLNCTIGPQEMLPLALEIIGAVDIPVIAQPNCEDEEGADVPAADAAEFAAVMKKLVDAGLTIAGGCCGSTPAYIEALVAAVRA
jgi:5-methyltetrahydrofolate--homocysteine methyltransferase